MADCQEDDVGCRPDRDGCRTRSTASRVFTIATLRRDGVKVEEAAEAGIPGFIFEEFFPMLAPVGTPAPIVAALGTAFQAAIQRSASQLNELAGVVPRAGYETPDQVMNLV